MPQSFYYFNAYAQLDKLGKADELVALASGNFGNITAGLFAYWMGLLIQRFCSGKTTANDVFLEYLNTGTYTNSPISRQILSERQRMVGDPSNFARIIDLFGAFNDPHKEICALISGHRYTDEEIASTMRAVYKETDISLTRTEPVATKGLHLTAI